MLAHSFDRFYVVTKFILFIFLKLSKLNYDNTCASLDEKTVMMQKLRNIL